MRAQWFVLAGAALALQSPARAGEDVRTLCFGTSVDGGGAWDIALAVPPPDNPKPDANYEGLPELEVHGFPEARIALMRWDISGLSATASLPRSVKIRLNFTKTTSQSIYGVHVLLRPWEANEATWLWPRLGSEWGYQGAAQDGIDYDSTDLAAFIPDQQTMEIDLDGGTALLAQWADAGQNFGIMIRNIVALDAAKFSSAEAENVALRPALVISKESGEVITLQEGDGGYYGAVDTNIASSAPATLDHQPLVVKGATLGPTPRLADSAVSLLRFDVSDIPSTAWVVGATLELWGPAEGSGRILVDGMLRDWSDREANWNHAAKGIAWGRPGALAVGTDRLGIVAADFQAQNGASSVDLTDAGIELVEAWVRGRLPNNGFLLGADSSGTMAMFLESEVIDQSPKLCVQYKMDRQLDLQIPCGCSAGGGLAAGALALPLLLRSLRRRRT